MLWLELAGTVVGLSCDLNILQYRPGANAIVLVGMLQE